METSTWKDVQWYISSGSLIIQFSSVAQPCQTLWPHKSQHTRPPCPSWSLLKLMPIESVMPSSHLILCHPLLLLSPIPPSIRVFSNESTLPMRWPKCWSFSFSISPSNEHPGLNSFRMDWLDLLAVQGTLKSLLQHHSSNASNFRRSALSLGKCKPKLWDTTSHPLGWLPFKKRTENKKVLARMLRNWNSCVLLVKV